MSDSGDDLEPRAAEVVAAAAGLSPAFDPSARWERGLSPPPVSIERFTPSIELRLDPTRWLYRDAASSREYDIPDELNHDLTHRVPQAFLRDLDRPEPVMGAARQPLEGTQLLGLWEEGSRLIADAKLRPERPHIESVSEVFVAEQERRRRFFAEPWQPALDDDAPRRLVQLYPSG